MSDDPAVARPPLPASPFKELINAWYQRHTELYRLGHLDEARALNICINELEIFEGASDPPRIRTRCPSCGHDTLFIGSGGWLVCSWLECKSPGAINNVAESSTANREAALTARPAPQPETADDYCATCGEVVSRHWTPCPFRPDADAVLRLLARLVGEGKRPAALRVLARHLRAQPDDGTRLVQSAASPAPPDPPEATTEFGEPCALFVPGGSNVAPDYYCKTCGYRKQDHPADPPEEAPPQ